MTDAKYNKFFKIEKIIYAISALVYFITMYYQDNQEIFLKSYYRLERLLGGNFYDFIFNWSHSLPYGILMQFLLVIWVFPIKLINVVFNVSIEYSLIAYLWYKLPIAIIFYFCVKESGKLAMAVKVNKIQIQYVELFIATSLIAFLPVFHVAQIDVMYLILMLYGVRKYIESDYRGFIVAFMLANPMKYISLVVFIPLILLKEKRVVYIMRDTLMGCVLMAVEFLIKRIMVGPSTANAMSSNATYAVVASAVDAPSTLAGSQMRALMFNVFNGPDGMDAATVIAAYCVVCVLAYWWNLNEKAEQKTIWISFASLAVLFAFGTTHCYWTVLMVPFLIILIFMNQKDLKLNLILENAMQVSLVGVFVSTQADVYGGSTTFDSLVLSLSNYLMNRRASHINNNVITYIMDNFIKENEYFRILPAIAVVSIVAIMIINAPYYLNKTSGEINENADTICIITGWIRLLILAGWFVVCFYCIFR